MLEVNQWATYRERRGSLNIGRCIEQAVANIGSVFINRELSSDDHIDPLILMPYEDSVEESFEDAMKSQ